MQVSDKSTENKSALIKKLASLYGIEESYQGFAGKSIVTSDKTALQLLGALLGQAVKTRDLESLVKTSEQEIWNQFLRPVYVVQATHFLCGVSLRLPASFNAEISWRLETESGGVNSGIVQFAELKKLEEKTIDNKTYVLYQMLLPLMPEHGYHKLQIAALGFCEGYSSLIVVPDNCYNPLINEEDSSKHKIWGPGIQLYSLRSKRNWGIGDFTDLACLAEELSKSGAGFIGINPLHALDAQDPEEASPYYPLSRFFYNYLYIDIEAIPDFVNNEEIKKLVYEEAFQAKLQACRDKELVDYSEIADLKLKILNSLFSNFLSQCANSNTFNTQRQSEFAKFKENSGETLHRYALFNALNEHFTQTKKTHAEDQPNSENVIAHGWRSWPRQYQNPSSPEVLQFGEVNSERVEFYKFLQWICHEQLERVSKTTRQLCAPLGIYGDLAVGISPYGADAWMNQSAFSLNVNIGAPPDPCSLKGQNWGLVTFNPVELIKQAYLPFIELLQQNMKLGGALRIDHFLAFNRIFSIPNSQEPNQKGAYIRFPMDDMLGILCLESHRNKCLVIGEDLGTVPKVITERMNAMGIISYKLMCFEKNSEGDFQAPENYKEKALLSFSTHDLPTFSGFWTGRGIAVKDELGLIPSKLLHKKLVKDSLLERSLLLNALDKEELLPEGTNRDPASIVGKEIDLIECLHEFLARANSLMLVVQLEDVLQQNEQVNLPGTTHKLYPNWRRKITVALEDLTQDERIKRVFKKTHSARGAEPVKKDSVGLARRQSCEIPRATYRLQLNKDFGFAQTIRLLPYLQKLGITHLYCSPILKARSKSSHGYDVVSHALINPEIGTEEEFNALTTELKNRGMGLLLDFVPNHMSTSHENEWWCDVLEHGLASQYAKYFDIDWRPIRKSLKDKILLPILHSSYGDCITNRHLKITFIPEEGSFKLLYEDKVLPIESISATKILSYRIEILASRLGENNIHFMEFQSIISGLQKLPDCNDFDSSKKNERAREVKILKNRLKLLCENAHVVGEFILENIEIYNKMPEVNSQELLHQLLEAQVYRLAFWKTSTEDINYRRFFDISELVGLRIESLVVFWETHQLILQLIAEDKIQGLRIDHPDGLYDPASYFSHLQEEVSKLKNIELAKQQQENLNQELPIYLIVEKILPIYEKLPDSWQVHGTSGYEFCNALSSLFVNGANHAKILQAYQEFTGQNLPEFSDLIYECKRLILKTSLTGELNSLVSQLAQIAESNLLTRDFTLSKLREALREVIACFPVYRTYITDKNISKKDKEYVFWAVNLARSKQKIEDSTIYDFLLDVLTLENSLGFEEAGRKKIVDFTMRMQQITGPVMAKGLEDTAFYRYNLLVSQNEVGADLKYFGCPVSSFHNQNTERVRRWPNSMLNTSTHDSKRAEDVRARINAISELPDEWMQLTKKLAKLNSPKKLDLSSVGGNDSAPSLQDEYFFYQTIIGSWPLELIFEQILDSDLEDYIKRIEDYALKSAREAKLQTSWLNPNLDYENSLTTFVRSVIRSLASLQEFHEFKAFTQKTSWIGMINSLSQILIKTTSPGVPDFYQGFEIWNFSLVDPDNRRLVDYEKIQSVYLRIEELLKSELNLALDEKQSLFSELLNNFYDSRIKLYICSKALSLKKEFANLFQKGDYAGLEASGKFEKNVIAFSRVYQDEVCIVATPVLVADLLVSKHEQNTFASTTKLGLDPTLESSPEQVTQLPKARNFCGANWSDTCVTLPEGFNSDYLYNYLTGDIIDCRNRTHLEVSEIFAHLPFAILTNKLPTDF